MKVLTRWLLRSLLCLVACSVLSEQVLACGFCSFEGIIVTGNDQAGSLTVPAGSNVTLKAFKKGNSDCTSLRLCNWTLNGAPTGWPRLSTVYYTFNTPGTYSVGANCECVPCDKRGAGYLTVYVTSDPPPPVGPPVTITYTTFIPLDHVRLDESFNAYFYEADNKGSHMPGETSFRIQQTVTVRTRQGIVSTGKESAISRLFKQNDPTPNLTTSGSCFRKDCPECPTYFHSSGGQPIVFQGQCLIRTAQPQDSGPAADMVSVMADNISAGYYDANRTFANVRLRGAPSVGVQPIWWSPIDPPAIDWDVTIELTRNVSTGVTGYKVTGKHDGFPFHDIRLNSTVVWQRDPILQSDPHANTPYALLPPSEVTVLAQGSF